MTKGAKSNTKRNYVPRRAAANFRPAMDWSVEEAKQEFFSQKFSFEVDKVIYGDCIEEMQNLPAESVDMIIADPPFGLDFNSKETLYNRKKANVIGGYKEIEIENYGTFTNKWISQLPRLLKEHGGAWIVSGWTNLKDILNALDKYKLVTINHIIWKYQFGVFTKKKFVTSHYHIIFAVKNPKKYFFNKVEHYPSDVWDIKRKYQPGIKKNATKLPIEVVKRCIDFGSKPGDLVLDPFMGNGTTAVASLGAYRHFIGFEINKELKEIIDWNINFTKIGQFYKAYSER